MRIHIEQITINGPAAVAPDGSGDDPGRAPTGRRARLASALFAFGLAVAANTDVILKLLGGS